MQWGEVTQSQHICSITYPHSLSIPVIAISLAGRLAQTFAFGLLHPNAVVPLQI